MLPASRATLLWSDLSCQSVNVILHVYDFDGSWCSIMLDTRALKRRHGKSRTRLQVSTWNDMERLKWIEMAHRCDLVLWCVVHGFDMWEVPAPMTPQLGDRTKSTIQEKDVELSGMICDLWCCYVGEHNSSQFQWTDRDVKLIRQSCR